MRIKASNRARLTILSEPMPIGLSFFSVYFRKFVRALKFYLFGQKINYHPTITGHYAVTRSIVHGLQKIGADFNYNPTKISDLADVVLVIAGTRSLRQMIQFKKLHLFKKLFAGPNNVVFSVDENSILASSEIDGLICHSAYTSKLWAMDYPKLANRCYLWPAGVDEEFWTPGLNPSSILIFDKRLQGDDSSRVDLYSEYLRNEGWTVEIILRCGRQGYSPEEYLALLKNSCLMVGFTVGSESQGIAWAEAWSCNVPTLILSNETNTFRGRKFSCSTAPFLCSENGLFFNDLNDFKVQFEYWKKHREQFKPRSWVLENMTDEICAKKIYNQLILP